MKMRDQSGRVGPGIPPSAATFNLERAVAGDQSPEASEEQDMTCMRHFTDGARSILATGRWKHRGRLASLLASLLFVASAAGLVEDKGAVAAALRASRKSDKPVLIEFSMTACGYCKRMRRETLADESVSGELVAFEHAAVDIERDPVSARIYGIRGVPAFVVLNAQGQEVSRLVGFAEAEAFRNWLWRVNESLGLEPAGKQAFEAFAKQVAEKLGREDKLEVGRGIGLLLGRTKWRDPLYREFATRQLAALAEKRPELLVPWLKAPKLVMRIHVYNALLGRVAGLEDFDPWEPPPQE